MALYKIQAAHMENDRLEVVASRHCEDDKQALNWFNFWLYEQPMRPFSALLVETFPNSLGDRHVKVLHNLL